MGVDQDELLVAGPVVRAVIRVAGNTQTLKTALSALPFPTGLEIVTVSEPGALLGQSGVLGALVFLRRRRRQPRP